MNNWSDYKEDTTCQKIKIEYGQRPELDTIATLHMKMNPEQ